MVPCPEIKWARIPSDVLVITNVRVCNSDRAASTAVAGRAYCLTAETAGTPVGCPGLRRHLLSGRFPSRWALHRWSLVLQRLFALVEQPSALASALHSRSNVG